MALMTGAIQRLINSIRSTIQSGVSFAGDLSHDLVYQYSRTLAGLISFAGKLSRKVPLSGEVIRKLDIKRTVSSGISFAGTALTGAGQYFTKTISGALSAAGSILYNEIYQNAKSSIATFSGAVSRLQEFLRTKSGSLNFSGATIRLNAILTKSYDGVIDFNGAVYRGIYKTLTSALSFSGSATISLVQRIYTASGAKNISRFVDAVRSKSGSLSLSGFLSSVVDINEQLFYYVGKAGTLTLSGAIQGIKNLIGETNSGTLEIYGRITIIDAIIDRLTDASISPIGVILHHLSTSRAKISSAISLSGVLLRINDLSKSAIGNAVSVTGAISYLVSGNRFYTAVSGISFSGAISNIFEFLRTKAGALNLAGTVSNIYNLSRTKAGGLSLSGLVSSLFFDADWRNGALSFSGIANRYSLVEVPTQSSAMTFGGGVSGEKTINRIQTGVIDFSKTFLKTRETLYLGPPNYGT